MVHLHDIPRQIQKAPQDKDTDDKVGTGMDVKRVDSDRLRIHADRGGKT